MRKKLLEKLTLRLDEDLVTLLEERARIVEDFAGVRVSRSEVARAAIERGLRALQEDEETAAGTAA